MMHFFYKKIDPIGFARSIGVRIGESCRLIDVEFSSEPYLVEIGDHVSATTTRFETHDGGVWIWAPPKTSGQSLIDLIHSA
jgi:hypothetical protein